MEKRIIVAETFIDSADPTISERRYYIMDGKEKTFDYIDRELSRLDEEFAEVVQDDYDEFLDDPDSMGASGAISRDLVSRNGGRIYWSLEWDEESEPDI